MSHYDRALSALEHEDTMSNRDNFHGDHRDAYLQRQRELALVHAILCVSDQLESIRTILLDAVPEGVKT